MSQGDTFIGPGAWLGPAGQAGHPPAEPATPVTVEHALARPRPRIRAGSRTCSRAYRGSSSSSSFQLPLWLPLPSPPGHDGSAVVLRPLPTWTLSSDGGHLGRRLAVLARPGHGCRRSRYAAHRVPVANGPQDAVRSRHRPEPGEEARVTHIRKASATWRDPGRHRRHLVRVGDRPPTRPAAQRRSGTALSAIPGVRQGPGRLRFPAGRDWSSGHMDGPGQPDAHQEVLERGPDGRGGRAGLRSR